MGKEECEAILQGRAFRWRSKGLGGGHKEVAEMLEGLDWKEATRKDASSTFTAPADSWLRFAFRSSF